MLGNITDLLRPAPIMVYNSGVIYPEEEISFTSEAIRMCQESYAQYKSLAIKAFNESTTLNEGLITDSTFVAVIRAILDIFIDTIKELVDRFLHVTHAFVGGEHHIEKYASQILSFEGPLKIEDFRWFRYTYLEADVPPMNLNTQISDEYDKTFDALRKIGRETDKKKLISALTQYAIKSKKDFKEESFRFRAKIVGKREEISKERYSEELRMYFRDGKSAAHLGPLSSQDIHEAYRRWKNEDIYEKDIKKKRATFENNAAEVKKKVKNIELGAITGNHYTSDYEVQSALNNVLQVECDKIQEMCNTCVLAFSAKLDAFKEAIIQDKKVLYHTISEIISDVHY